MPLFYFDVFKCRDPITDATRRIVADAAVARSHALNPLIHLAKHDCPDYQISDFRMKIRDETGRVVLITRLFEKKKVTRVQTH